MEITLSRSCLGFELFYFLVDFQKFYGTFYEFRTLKCKRMKRSHFAGSALGQGDMSLVVTKPVFGVSDKAQHKPGCTITHDG